MNTNSKTRKAAGAQKSATTTAAVKAADSSGVLPEFGRIPDVQRLYGLRRGKLYQLLNAGKIKSVSLREPGKKFGCRLIHLQSVRDFLLKQLDADNDGQAGV